MIATGTVFVAVWESLVAANGRRASAFSERQLAVFLAVVAFALVPLVAEALVAGMPAVATFRRGIRVKCDVLREWLRDAYALSYATRAR